MRRILVLASFLACVGVAAETRADPHAFGLGVILGTPSGLSAKAYLARAHAIDVAIGAAFVHGNGFHISADYLWHPVILADDEAFTLPLYFGVGGRMLLRGEDANGSSKFHLGPRIPVGILFDFKTI